MGVVTAGGVPRGKMKRRIARGSLSEVDTYIEIARRLGYIEKGPIAIVEEKMMDVDKIITGLVQSLKKKA